MKRFQSIATTSKAAKTAARFALPSLVLIALLGVNDAASARTFTIPGAACQPENSTYVYLENIQGVYNASNTTQTWICPITRLSSDNRTGTGSSVRVIQNHLTQEITCGFVTTTFAGGLRKGQVRSTVDQGVTSILLNYEFILFSSSIPSASYGYAYGIKCSIPPVDRGKYSGILFYTVDVEDP